MGQRRVTPSLADSDSPASLSATAAAIWALSPSWVEAAAMAEVMLAARPSLLGWAALPSMLFIMLRKNSNHNHCCHLPCPCWLPATYAYEPWRRYNHCSALVCAVSHGLQLDVPFYHQQCLALHHFHGERAQPPLNLILIWMTSFFWEAIPATTWPHTPLKFF